MEADFSGYATKAGLKCSDGRTIMAHAFKENDGTKVPLVWQHGHNEPANVLGHAMLENREDGVYAYGFFNETEAAQSAKTLVRHGDITALSIYANQLVERAKSVFHGKIREVSLVLSGANPGALIDNISLAHADGEVDVLDDEAIIYTGLTIEHSDEDDEDEEEDEEMEHADDEGKTVKDVYDALTEEQKAVVHFMVGKAIESNDKSDAKHSDDQNNEEGDLEHQEGNDDMSRNVFEQGGTTKQDRPTLTHSQLETIVDDAKKMGSFKESFLAHAAEYGIENIDMLFPDAKAVTSSPDFVKRRTEWVAGVINGTRHSPFSRVKSLSADITHDEARAKGYIKGTMKKDEFFALAKRVTTPTTIYKKQKLDRDDIIDITDLDVVAWLKAEMRVMLDEELAGAVLFGDGREADDEDKIKDPAGASEGAGIRAISQDDEFYAPVVEVDTSTNPDAAIDAIVRALADYEGSGSPTLYTSANTVTDLLLQKDTLGRRLYPTMAELTSALTVSKVVSVPSAVLSRDPGLIGVIVNLSDYTLGADRGGSVSMFDDFDIDYNQFKYLIETRVSGALTRPKSAVVLREAGTTPPEEDPEG